MARRKKNQFIWLDSFVVSFFSLQKAHKIMFHGWNKMVLALEHLQEIEKQMICITKALCQGRFKSLKIGYNVQR